MSVSLIYIVSNLGGSFVYYYTAVLLSKNVERDATV